MAESALNLTTLLSELTQEQLNNMRNIPNRDPLLPDNMYPVAELTESRFSIHRTVTTETGVVPLHTHTFYEYIYCLQVSDMEYLVGTHRYRIRPGDIIYIPPGIPHRPIFPDGRTNAFVRDELWLRADFADRIGRRLPVDIFSGRKTPYLFRMEAHWQAEISGLLQKGVAENEQKQFRWDNAVEGYVLLIMVAMSRALLDEQTQLLQQEEPNLFDQIVSYLEANLSRKITLDETAHHFFISKSTINRTFQKHMGTSFYRCLNQRRLLAARNMILEGIPLEEVSVKTGFSDYATFYRAFKREFSISPRDFKKLEEHKAETASAAGIFDRQ